MKYRAIGFLIITASFLTFALLIMLAKVAAVINHSDWFGQIPIMVFLIILVVIIFGLYILNKEDE